MSDNTYRVGEGKHFSDETSPERLRDIIRHLEEARGSICVRVEVNLDMRRPSVVVTASSQQKEEDLARYLAPHIQQALNATYGELLKLFTAALQAESGAPR